MVTSLRKAAQRSSLSESTTGLTKDSAGMPLKLALFNLQKYVKEEEFASEFLLRGGVRILVGLLEKTEGGLAGNSLAVSP